MADENSGPEESCRDDIDRMIELIMRHTPARGRGGGKQ